MARPKPYTQDDVKRAVKGAIAAGVSVGRVEIGPDGKIIIIAGTPEKPAPVISTLDEWKARRARQA